MSGKQWAVVVVGAVAAALVPGAAFVCLWYGLAAGLVLGLAAVGLLAWAAWSCWASAPDPGARAQGWRQLGLVVAGVFLAFGAGYVFLQYGDGSGRPLDAWGGPLGVLMCFMACGLVVWAAWLPKRGVGDAQADATGCKQTALAVSAVFLVLVGLSMSVLLYGGGTNADPAWFNGPLPPTAVPLVLGTVIAALGLAMWAARLKLGFGSVECVVLVLLLGGITVYAVQGDARGRVPPGPEKVCLSNLKQLALATEMYAQDYDGGLPAAANWPVALYPYVRNYRMYKCPSDKRPMGTPFSAPGWSRKAWLSYGANLKLCGAKTDSIQHPDKAIWLFDCDGLLGYPELAARRHNHGANFAFADGHVKWLAPKDLRSLQSAKTAQKAVPKR